MQQLATSNDITIIVIIVIIVIILIILTILIIVIILVILIIVIFTIITIVVYYWISIVTMFRFGLKNEPISKAGAPLEFR